MSTGRSSIFGGSLLIAGTSIGGGMLALPVLTSQAGLLPSICIYLACWLFMACTGLLFLEISQWIKADANIISMAERTLGQVGKFFAWIVYIFLFYCLTIAYIVGCGNMVSQFFHHSIPDWLGPILFVFLFAPLILIPAFFVEKLNIFLVAGLAFCYFGFVFLGYQYVQTDLLYSHNWSYSLGVLPIAFTSFAYQGIIPTLANHLQYDIKKIRYSILVGSFIPLIAYIIWEWLILGIVPLEGRHGLLAALQSGDNAVYPLKHFIHNSFVNTLAQFFAFFALVTSFLGVTLGLRDFFADGLRIEKKGMGKLVLLVLVFLFPLLVAISYPKIFLIAIEYAGGFGCALLLGLLPILMTWIGRYRLHLEPVRPQLPGGKLTLIALGSFVGIELVSEFYRLVYRLTQ